MPRGRARAGAGRPRKNGAVETPPLRLEWRSPAELAENPRNWRRHPEAQVAALTDALAEVGWAGACLYNERTGRLIDGHARRKVALDQGAERVPVLVGSWDEAQEAKILATLDPLGAMATADAQALDALLREVHTGSQAVANMLTELAGAAGIRTAPPGEGGTADVGEVYQGMPECEQEDQTAAYTVHVHFDTAGALRDFGQRIGQEVDEKTRWLWHPRKEYAAREAFTVEDGGREP